MRHLSFLKIRLDFLASNLDAIRAISTNKEIIPMVKANAYGHGLIPIAQFLVNDLGLKNLGLASLGEAFILRQEKLQAKLYVFSETELMNNQTNNAYLDNSIRPVIYSLDQLQFVLNQEKFSHLPLVLKFDTGMNRLGIDYHDCEKISSLLLSHNRREVEHIMTHFALSFHTLKDGDKTHRQYERFIKICSHFQAAGIDVKETSVSNSGAIEQSFGLTQTHIRPGLMLYGAPSSAREVIIKNKIELKIISSLKTQVIKKMKAVRGAPIGYGVNVLPHDSTILVVPIGYGDGFLTHWSGLEFSLKSFRAKIFGRVNMDMLFIQLPEEAYSSFSVGEEISLWDHNPENMLDFCSQVKTIPYQVFCAVSSRVPRIYRLK